MQYNYTTSNEAALAGINKSATMYDPDLEPLSAQELENRWRTNRVNDLADSVRQYMDGGKLDAYRESALNAINNRPQSPIMHSYSESVYTDPESGVTGVMSHGYPSNIPHSLGYDAYKMPTEYLSGLRDYIGATKDFGQDMSRRFAATRDAFNADLQQRLSDADEADIAINRARTAHTPQMFSAEMNRHMQPFYNQVDAYTQAANSYNPNLHNYPYEGYRDDIWRYPVDELKVLNNELGNGYNAFKQDFNNVYMPSTRAISNATLGLADKLGYDYYGNRYEQLRAIDKKLIPAYENAASNALDLTRTHIVPGLVQNAQGVADKFSNELLPAYGNAIGRYANQYQQHWADTDVRGAANALEASNNLYGNVSGLVRDFRNNWNDNRHSVTIGEITRDARILGDRFARAHRGATEYEHQVGQHLQDARGRSVQNARNIVNDTIDSDQFNHLRQTATGGVVGAASQLTDTARQTAQRVKQSPDYERLRQQATPLLNTGKNLLQNFRNRGR